MFVYKSGWNGSFPHICFSDVCGCPQVVQSVRSDRNTGKLKSDIHSLGWYSGLGLFKLFFFFAIIHSKKLILLCSLVHIHTHTIHMNNWNKRLKKQCLHYDGWGILMFYILSYFIKKKKSLYPLNWFCCSQPLENLCLELNYCAYCLLGLDLKRIWMFFRALILASNMQVIVWPI